MVVIHQSSPHTAYSSISRQSRAITKTTSSYPAPGPRDPPIFRNRHSTRPLVIWRVCSLHVSSRRSPTCRVKGGVCKWHYGETSPGVIDVKGKGSLVLEGIPMNTLACASKTPSINVGNLSISAFRDVNQLEGAVAPFSGGKIVAS